MERSSVVYDIILLESDRIIAKKTPINDLYYRDEYGDFVKVAEGYDRSVLEVLDKLGRKKRMKYFMTFFDALCVQDELLQSTNRVLRHFVKNMSYMNMVRDVPVRDIVYDTGIASGYVQRAIKDLCEKDIIRFVEKKKRRTYVVNPVHFYKGSLKSLFTVIRNYESYPVRDRELNEITVEKFVNLGEKEHEEAKIK